eukprot:745622-Hanusia_phi.AAC.5
MSCPLLRSDLPQAHTPPTARPPSDPASCSDPCSTDRAPEQIASQLAHCRPAPASDLLVVDLQVGGPDQERHVSHAINLPGPQSPPPASKVAPTCSNMKEKERGVIPRSSGTSHTP